MTDRGHMTALAALNREVTACLTLDHEVVRIRVTPDAIEDSIVALPLSQRGRFGQAEILVHPFDWVELLGALPFDVDQGTVTKACGIPVAYDERVQ